MKSRIALLVLATTLACHRDTRQQPAIAVDRTPPAPDVTSMPTGAPVIAQLTSGPQVPTRPYREHPAKVIVDLAVKEVTKQVAPGVSYTFWTFGGDVPGKFIRVRLGDVIELHLKNDPRNKLPHNIDLHAVSGPGGGAVSTFTAPGHESVFTFRATHQGLYVYHCATAPVPMHVANGMYGLILVEPPGGLPRVDKEFYVMQGELYTAGKYHAAGLQAFDMQKGEDERPTYVLFNGAEGSLTGDNAMKVNTGDKVRLFVGNGGPNLVSSFHVIGGIFDTVYPEGGAHPQEYVQTTLIPSGGAAIVELTFEVPGTYTLVDHSLFRAFDKGAIAQIVVTGPTRNDLMSPKLADTAYDGRDATGGMVVPQISAAPTGPITDEQRVELGKATFGRICAACHQPAGQGVAGTFPPLAGSDYLASSSHEKLIGHLLHGLQGPLTVNGNQYNNTMPPLQFLSDDEIAGALTFVRSAFGNHLDAVSPKEVAKVRSTQASAP